MRTRRTMVGIEVALAALTCAGSASASIIWDGPDMTFTKANFANPALPENQDRITPNVWITRADTQGLFNANSEVAFSHLMSPAGTEWADGSLANYNSLTFTDWETWAGSHFGGPPATVGVPAVLHLVQEDIYLSITFTSWTPLGGGGFSYRRSTVPAPASLPLLGLAGLVISRRRRRAGQGT